MGRRNRSILLGNNLPQLQNLIKRDSESYKEEFLQQYRHFESSLSLFELKPDIENKELGELIMFLSQVVKLYDEQAKEFPNKLIDILTRFHMVLCPDLRKSIVQALILLKNKGVIESMDLHSLFFTLFRCPDKLLREIVYNFIITDIKDANSKHKDNRLNKTLQNFLYSVFQKAQVKSNDNTDTNQNIIAAKKSLQVCIELYKKNIWNDKKTVNVVAEACLSSIPKLVFPAAHFFLGNNEDEDSEDEEEIDISKLDHQSQINKKTKARARKREKAIASIKRKERKGKKAEVFNFSALHLVNDPQGFAEKVFNRLNKANNEGFEIKLILMKLIARLIGVHKLLILNFYTYLIKYIQPHQRDVTQILALTAQACHELVPPDTLEPLVMAITRNFVSDNMANEVISAGINSIREICTRAPLVMNETLLQDLTEFKKIKDKSVVMASRSLIQLFREINPSLLKKKDRGRNAIVSKIAGNEIKPLGYGQVDTAEGIAGAELLEDDNEDEDQNNDIEEELEFDVGNEEVDDEKEEDGEDEDEEGEEEEQSEEEEDDEEGTEENQEENESVESEEKKKKLRVDAMRILTDEDFKMIRRKKRNLALNLDPKVAAKRKLNDNDTDSEGDSDASSEDNKNTEIVDEAAITRYRKKTKQDYEQRMESIKAGREGRAKFGSNFSKKTDKHSTTNRQKKRGKNFLMVAHKKGVLQKAKMSLRDKQTQLRARIEKQKKRKH